MMLSRKQRDAILAEMYNASECPRSWFWEQADCSLSYIAFDAVVVMVVPCQIPDSESFSLQVAFSRLQLLPQSSHEPTRSLKLKLSCQTSPRLEFRAYSNCPSREWVNVCGGKWPWYIFENLVSLPVLLTTVPKLISHTSIRHQELTLLGASSGFNIQWWRLIEDYWRISRPFLKGHTFEQVQIRVIGRVDWSCRYKYLILNLLMTGRQEMFSASLITNAQMVSAWFRGDLPH